MNTINSINIFSYKNINYNAKTNLPFRGFRPIQCDTFSFSTIKESFDDKKEKVKENFVHNNIEKHFDKLKTVIEAIDNKDYQGINTIQSAYKFAQKYIAHKNETLKELLDNLSDDDLTAQKQMSLDKQYNSFNILRALFKIFKQSHAINLTIPQDDLKALLSESPDLNIGSGVDMDIYRLEYANKNIKKNGVIDTISTLTCSDFNYHYITNMASEKEKKEMEARLDYQLQKCLSHPELYTNGDNNDSETLKEDIKIYFDSAKIPLLAMTTIFDKETFDEIFRQRLLEVTDYFDGLSTLSIDETNMLKKMMNSKNENGRPFTSKEKLGMLYLICAYKNNNLGFEKLNNMIKENKVDITTIHIDLLKKLLKSSGLSEEEINSMPQEKLLSWDLKYIHLLAKDMEKSEDTGYDNILLASNFTNFKAFIHDKTNIYGQTNAKTKEMFEQYGIDYNLWLNPPKDLEINFKTDDEYQESKRLIIKQIKQSVDELRKTKAKCYIDKILNKYIEKDAFIIPEKISGNKIKFENFVKNLIIQLDYIWKRAEKNTFSDKKEERISGNKALQVKRNLNVIINNIQNLKFAKENSEIDWTIKMWDRLPQKDLFQGNYSACCIAMGGTTSKAVPAYLLNTAFNMIEIKDNKSGKIIGNALIYYVKNKNNINLIVDNIEINNNNKPTKEIQKTLRNAIARYAKNLDEKLTGRKYSHIYMGGKNNDVAIDDLDYEKSTVSLLGQTVEKDLYLDLFEGWTTNQTVEEDVILFDMIPNKKPACF